MEKSPVLTVWYEVRSDTQLPESGVGGVWEKLRDDREREFFHKKLTKSEKAVCPGKVFLIFCTCSK